MFVRTTVAVSTRAPTDATNFLFIRQSQHKTCDCDCFERCCSCHWYQVGVLVRIAQKSTPERRSPHHQVTLSLPMGMIPSAHGCRAPWPGAVSVGSGGITKPKLPQGAKAV